MASVAGRPTPHGAPPKLVQSRRDDTITGPLPLSRNYSKSRVESWFAAVALSALIAALFAHIVQYSLNFPANHPLWVNRKQSVAAALMGLGPSEARTRNLLQGNKLNLQAWYGN